MLCVSRFHYTWAFTFVQSINFTTLHVQRLRNILISVFKIVHNLSPNLVGDLYTITNKRSSRRLLPLAIPRVRTTKYGLNSISYLGSKLWNELENDYKMCDELEDFKSCLANWTGPVCKCNLCRYNFDTWCVQLHRTSIAECISSHCIFCHHYYLFCHVTCIYFSLIFHTCLSLFYLTVDISSSIANVVPLHKYRL